MAYQNTDPNLLDTVPGYDVYGFGTGALDEEQPSHDFDLEDPDGLPCRCGATNCPDRRLPHNPYL